MGNKWPKFYYFKIRFQRASVKKTSCDAAHPMLWVHWIRCM